jgi:Zn-dependent protease/predicted transcriptional regulator
MKWAILIGKISGIKLYIHWTFFILLGWIFIMNLNQGESWQQAAMGVVLVLSLFVCVVLHEFGHALVAKRYKYQTQSITLLPIGGIAQLAQLPEKPVQELWVALAGPAVNIVIAGIIYGILYLTGNIPEHFDMNQFGKTDFLYSLVIANLTLAVFNLIPAFPMDGGRVLRALLALKAERGKATRIAATVGQVLAVVFVLIGFYSNIWLVLIGVFIFMGAGAEAAYERTRSAMAGLKVKDAMMTRFTILAPGDQVDKAVKLLLEGQDKEFLVGNGDRIEGVLSRTDIISGLSEFGGEAPVSSVMHKDYLKLKPDMALKDAFNSFATANTDMCPVYENDHLVGLLDKESINELLMIKESKKTE